MQMLHQDPEPLVEFSGDIPDLLSLAGAGVLLPTVCDAPQKGDERGRSRNQDSLPHRVVEQLGTLFAGRRKKVIRRYEAHREIDSVFDLGGVVSLGQRADVPGDRSGVGAEGSAPLLRRLCGGRALELIERELRINDKLAPPGQSQHDVRTTAVNDDLNLKVSVLIHPGRLKEILQHQFTGPATLARIGENHTEVLYLHQCFIKPGLYLTL
jgi:hypothetical protein